MDIASQSNRPFQMRAWSCITSYPLRGLPYLAYDNVNPAMVNSMMLHSSMHDLKRSIEGTKIELGGALNTDQCTRCNNKYE